ncbi:DMT family transporter [Melghirimyces algeriensis]|uniref:Transporter family-2 protein n=1 Tax=Melghirimyces algeriensis TaxID=910412 RepID=A0A521FHW7_9BACL|nr:DMT family transporter [Melghirimyces algeriensis]SMO95659.1 transporter family-2 protein [Melghirimyces algeriensis]
MKIPFYIAALIAGLSLSLEAGIGGTLGQNIGEMETTFYMMSMSAMVMVFIILFFGKGDLAQIFKVPKWNLLGGILGGFYNLILIISVPIIGVGISVIAALIGQIAMSAFIEQFGWLGSQKIKFNINRFAAIMLLAISLYLVY